MLQDHRRNYSQEPRFYPRPAIGHAAIMAEAQGISPWVGGPTTPYVVPSKIKAKPTNKPGAANQIPPEIASSIARYLDVKDLGRAAMAWRSVALASYASPEYIKLECGKYSLLTNGASTWPPELMRTVRERMEMYNFAWSTAQYSLTRSMDIPHAEGTPWAGDSGWKSGNHFMGESNGYIYDVLSWQGQGGMLARVSLYQLPSFRIAEIELKRTQFDVVLRSHFVRAVAVDPVGQVVAVLEYNNNETRDLNSRYPYLHVFRLNGQHIKSLALRIGFQTFAEVSHMELHGEMVCIIDDVGSNGKFSDIRIHNWIGEERSVCIDRPFNLGAYCTGFQFITEDLWILTELGPTHPHDTSPTYAIRAGHVRLKRQTLVRLSDLNGQNWTPNTISLIRNVSRYAPDLGRFCPNPATRLFGIKYGYRNYNGGSIMNACLFGRTTVESWLGIPSKTPLEPVHWTTMPIMDTTNPLTLNGGKGSTAYQYDPSNHVGLAVIGRRLFWAEVHPEGWSFNVLDYNPGAGNAIPAHPEPRGGEWKSFTCNFSSDPYPVAWTTTSRIYYLNRVIPTEDGLLLSRSDSHGPGAYTMLLM